MEEIENKELTVGRLQEAIEDSIQVLEDSDLEKNEKERIIADLRHELNTLAAVRRAWDEEVVDREER